ncbi:MAG TPA: hypothetical protein VL201_02875 [Patescibacteria group bacterium]|jgi:hypothetical protein|nr:hypothetical protein [Patescibacteria group bacterium]
MNILRNTIFQTALVASAVFSLAADSSNGVAPYLSLRPASRDLAGRNVNLTSHHRHLYGMESYYGDLDIRFKYGQSFRNSHINKALFGPALASGVTTTPTTGCSGGCDSSNQIVISGSAVTGRNGIFEFRAEDFYLPRDYKSTLTFSPKRQYFQLDLEFHMSLDEWVEGLYFGIYGPFVHSRHDLNFEETNITKGTVGYAAGYFDTVAIAVGDLNASFAAYAAGVSTIKTTTVKANTLNNAKFSCEDHSRNEFGELRVELGYDFLLAEDYHLGVAFEFAAPTGHRPTGEFLFEPLATNGKHWEVGGRVSAHYTMWRSEDEEKHFDFIVDADFMHLLKGRQRRTFDLIGKPLSRYMLAEKMQKNPGNLGTNQTGNPQPAFQFAGEYTPVANISTLDVKTSVGVQADVVGMFNFTCKGLTWDLGYEFFGGSKEKVHGLDGGCNDSCEAATFAANTWALKGNASVYGYATAAVPNPTPLSATDSSATIFSSKIASSVVNNTGIDTPFPAVNLNGTPVVVTPLNVNTTSDPLVPINTSATPVLIALTDLNIEGAATKVQSHKLFTHVGYTWVDREDWVPFIGVGAEVEFGRSHHGSHGCPANTTTTTSTCSSSSINTALSQWGVWLKGGVSFN